MVNEVKSSLLKILLIIIIIEWTRYLLPVSLLLIPLSSSESQPLSQLIRKDGIDVEDDRSSKAKTIRFSGASRYTIVIKQGLKQNGSEGTQGSDGPGIQEPWTNNRRLNPYYDIFSMEIVSGDGQRRWSKGRYMQSEPKDRLVDLWHEESNPYNYEEVFQFAEKNTNFDVYARDPRSDLIPGTKYQLYLSVWLFDTATEWKHPLEVRGKGISDLVSSARLPTDNCNPFIEASWVSFVVAKFTATNAKKLAFHIYDKTGQIMGNFYLRGFGYYRV